MKNLKKLLPFLLLFIACNQHKEEKSPAFITDSATTTVPKDTAIVKDDRHYSWVADWESGDGMVMKKFEPIPQDSLNINNMLERLNSLYPEVKLNYQETKGDTLFLNIKKSNYLTQQMGSSGAEGYLGEVVFNMTEIPGISHVNIHFKPGDHAEPGVYSRTDFVNKPHR